MKRILICSVFVLGAALWGAAQDAALPADYAATGNQFLQVCDHPGPPTLEMFECNAYVEGVVAGSELTFQLSPGKHRPQLYCIPSGVTLGQNLQVVIAFIKAHPAQAHLQTSVVRHAD